MVYGELGRYPLNIEYTSRCILFWARIISGPVSKLSVKMYNLLYKMYNLGIYNSPWLSWLALWRTPRLVLNALFGQST